MIINSISWLKASFPVLFAFGTFSKGVIPRRFQNRQPKREKIFTRDDKLIEYNPVQALALVRLHTFTNFKESV